MRRGRCSAGAPGSSGRTGHGMNRLEQDQVGSCSFVDVLEEAVLVKRPVAIELRDGTTFIDQVTDVTTESGQDFAVFRSHARVPIKEIAAATRAEPPRRSEERRVGKGCD